MTLAGSQDFVPMVKNVIKKYEYGTRLDWSGLPTTGAGPEIACIQL